MLSREGVERAKAYILSQQQFQVPISGIDKAKAYILAQRNQQPTPEPEEESFTPLPRQALEVGRGIGTGATGMLDIVGQPEFATELEAAKVHQPSTLERALRSFNLGMHGLPEEQMPEATEEELLQAQQQLPEAGATPHFTRAYEEATGVGAPQTKEAQYRQTLGEFLSPMPGSGYAKAVKTGIKALAKAAGKETARGLGATTLIESTPHLAEEGSGLGTLENIGKAVLGSKAGEKLLRPSNLSILNPKKAALAAATLGSKPNKEVFDLAEKHGIELPFNVGMNSTPLNFTANNAFKTAFISGKYKEAIGRSNEQMVNAVKKSIDTLGESDLKPSEASQVYRAHAKEAEKAAEKQGKKLYEKAESYVKPTDVVVPTHTRKAILKMREILDADIQAPQTKKVLGVLSDLGRKWGIIDPKIPEGFETNPKGAKLLLDAYAKQSGPIHANRLEGVRKNLNLITQYGEDVKGVENLLVGLSNAVEKDLMSTANPEYVHHLKEAKTFWRKEVGERFREKIARSLLTGEAPVDAYAKMNSINNVRLLKKIAGETLQGREVYNSLAKAKATDIMSKALSDEGVQYGNLHNLFTRRGKSYTHNQELLKELLGESDYKNLEEVAQIAGEFKKSGRELLNTSGTAHAAKDFAAISALFTSLVTASPLAAAGSAAYIAAPNVMSRIAANPKAVKQMRAYAVARQQGRERDARTILNKLYDTTKSEAKTAVIAGQHRQEEGKQPSREPTEAVKQRSR